jgi:hypothetical protein
MSLPYACNGQTHEIKYLSLGDVTRYHIPQITENNEFAVSVAPVKPPARQCSLAVQTLARTLDRIALWVG